MSIDNVNANNSLVIYGKFSVEEITETLKKCYPNRTIKYLSNPVASLNGHQADITISKHLPNERELLLAKLEEKQKDLKQAEDACHKSTLSVQALHKQQKALFDEFVLLRQKYDEQKTTIVNILWNHCSQYHPDLREIPPVEEDANLIETEERVGDYLVGEMLGEGQFATVKSCVHIRTKESYALKIIKKDRITSFTSLTRVSNEIESLKLLRMNHFVIGIRQVIHSKTMLYIIAEKGGYDLFEFFDEHPMGVNEAWAKQILTCILKGVLHCHELGICHRDLKPENILLSFDAKEGRCIDLKLCDFGLSTKFKPKIPLSDFCGSPGFFAPEMIIHGSYFGDKADVWSIGCILLELVLGHERFCDIWMTSYDYDILQDKTSFTKTIAEAVETLPDVLNFSPALNEFILKFLQLRASKRATTAGISTHVWLEGSMDQELVHLRNQNRLSVDIPMSPSGGGKSPVNTALVSFGGSLTPNASSYDTFSGGELGFNAFQVNPDFLKAAFDNLSDKERRHMEEYILTHKNSNDFNESHHHLSLPPIEPPTPSINKAKKILRKGDEVANHANERDFRITNHQNHAAMSIVTQPGAVNLFSPPSSMSMGSSSSDHVAPTTSPLSGGHMNNSNSSPQLNNRQRTNSNHALHRNGHSPLPAVSETNEIHYFSEAKQQSLNQHPHLRSQSKDSIIPHITATTDKKGFLYSSSSDGGFNSSP